MRNKKAIGAAFFTMLLWGSLFPMVKLGYSAYGVAGTADILLFAGVRFTICGGAICLYSLVRNRSEFLPVRAAVVPVLLVAVFSIVLHYGFSYVGLQWTDSSKTAILKQVGVLFYVFFSAVFFKNDRLTAAKFVGVLMGFAGILAINASSGRFTFHVGDALIIAASFCTVFANVISKNVFCTVAPVVATGCSQLFGGIVLLAAGLLMGGSMTVRLDWSVWILVYIVAASVVSYCIWYTVVKTGELSQLFIIKFSEPLFAAVFGAIILKEDICRPEYLVAFLLIAGGIWIANRGPAYETNQS